MRDWTEDQDPKLEERARDLSRFHGVRLAIALEAVKEPLWRLRDTLLIAGPLSPRDNIPGFRIREPKENFLDIPDPEDVLGIDSTIKGTDIRPYVYSQKRSKDLFQEMARRAALIDGAAVGNIWLYRELVRAGVEAVDLEPIPFYYVHGRDDLRLIRGWGGLRLGIIPVAILQEPLEQAWIHEGKSLSQDQFESLGLDRISFEGLQLLLAGKEPLPTDLLRRPRLVADPNYDPWGLSYPSGSAAEEEG